MPTRLIELVERLSGARVVLLGDLMIDRYIYGNAERLSPDAPVPVLHYQREEHRLGGAGRVAADLATLGAGVEVVSIVGDDETGQRIRRLLADHRAGMDHLIETPDRPTTSKVRLVGLAQHRHPQQMLRLDYENPHPIDAHTRQALLQRIDRALETADVLCIEDYDKGLLTPELCRDAIAAARQRGVPVLVDPAAVSDYSKYAGATAITPNRTETEKATGLPCDAEADYRRAAEQFLDVLDLDAVLLTLDRHGIYLAERAGERRWLQTRPRNVYDVAGAGDMVLAMLAVARAAGASWTEAGALANVASGLEVERFGSVPITPGEIMHELLSEVHREFGKQRSLDRRDR